MSRMYVPDGIAEAQAMSRVTRMGIGAHQDDLEIFAYHGIAACYESEDEWFAGVTVTDGGGSARVGPYQDFTDEEMKAKRVAEQNEAARLGRYALQVQLGVPSSQVKDHESSRALVDDLEALLRSCSPRVLYLHNPADKHDTHIAVLSRCLEALRRLPPALHPEAVYGCEVWRDLDWLDDGRKIALPVDAYPDLARQLIEVFDSQVAGGKDYVAAALGRRFANATFFQSHSVDTAKALTFAMDLKPLLAEHAPSPADYVKGFIDHFKMDTLQRIERFAAK
ncbi:PIG-L family deacetylase [Pelagicoccus sp. SDUM812003]|uniref:PIG-L deacetylase family protein n=1 Tax=Pelagicoccus sp. SDUM812003 TaxID=3041267 RepID=UPI00280F6243|nr:PIG-L family deacetylase [Pelagicoccus sp. SDUM812003]MDQ8205218.1 PIG-L family deacetylase [Pelagicoccus sp. SDUM812003]